MSPNRPRIQIAIGAYAAMVCVGSFYGLSPVQEGLERHMDGPSWAKFLPFGAISLGLAVGCLVAGNLYGRFGPGLIISLGLTIWGGSLAALSRYIGNGSWSSALSILCVAGIGTGFTYLAIVCLMGAVFSDTPLVGGAIGPLGFASGTALAMVASSYSDVRDISVERLSQSISTAGLVTLAVAIIAYCWLPSRGLVQPRAGHATTKSSHHLPVIWYILFGNAFPGMLLLCRAIPWAIRSDIGTTTQEVSSFLAISTIALFLGGLLAASIVARTSISSALVTLLAIRGSLLLTLTLAPSRWTGRLAIIAILFGHGFGFSVLPGYVRKQDQPGHFPRNYGQVLTGWGLSGVFGSVLDTIESAYELGFDLGVIVSLVIILITAFLAMKYLP